MHDPRDAIYGVVVDPAIDTARCGGQGCGGEHLDPPVDVLILSSEIWHVVAGNIIGTVVKTCLGSPCLTALTIQPPCNTVLAMSASIVFLHQSSVITSSVSSVNTAAENWRSFVINAMPLAGITRWKTFAHDVFPESSGPQPTSFRHFCGTFDVMRH